MHNESFNLIMCSGDYEDNENRVEILSDNYQWSNNRRLKISTIEDLEYAKGIVLQSYEKAKNR